MSTDKTSSTVIPLQVTPVSNADRINILIVDDEPKNLTVLESILDDPTYRFVRAETADQALLALVSEDFALIILDIRMPGMTGFELAQMIKERRKTARVPIIFLTAYYQEDQHKLEGYDTGAVDYLHKPVNPNVLRSKVAVFADLNRKRKELSTANHALLAEIAERGRVEERLRELNETLEKRVSDRTEALQEADNRKNEFLAMLAHELRNPLAPIRNAVQILRLKGTDPHVVASTSEMMDRQLAQMVRLVDDLLDISRITRGKIELRLSRVELASPIHHAIEAAKALMQERNHDFTVTLAQTPIFVNGDPIRLAQIVGNLLNNASKFTGKGGCIWLSLNRENDHAVIRVRDNGKGIKADQLSRIFDMFVQFDSSLERTTGGLGIGLSLVKNLVAMHNGSVEVTSAGADKGSEFVVRLPIIVETIQTVSPPPDIEAGKRKSRRILVVDDNVDSANSMASLLTMIGNETFTAYDGLAAVASAESVRPDVILLDIGMPKLDGYEACRRIRENEWAKNILLVALTGWGQEEDKNKTSTAGFNSHLVKPVELDILLKLLSQ